MNIDYSGFNARMGIRGVVAVILAFFLGSIFGQPGVIIAISTVIISLADFNGPIYERLSYLGIFSLLGALVTLAAGIFGLGMWQMMISTGLITFFCALTIVFGSRIAMFAMLLNVWYIIAQPVGGAHPFIVSPVCFIIGGIIIMAEITIISVLRRGGHPPDLQKRDPMEESPVLTGLLSLESPIFRFSFIKAAAVGLSTLAGWMLTGSHPFWVTYSPLTIIKPDLHQTVTSGIQRVAGTILGGIAAIILTGIFYTTEMLQVLFIAAAFFMLATSKVNYTIFISFLTILVVIATKMGGAQFWSPELERIVATVLGVLIAFSVIVILRFVLHRINKSHMESSG